MFKPGYNIWNNIPVFAIDYRLESGEVQNGMMDTITSHTVTATIMDSQNVDMFKNYFRSLEASVHQELADKLTPGEPLVMLALPEFETLTIAEQASVMHHEHCHILRGDLEYDESAPKRGIADDIEMERECDAHAVKMMGADYIKSAISKLLLRSAMMAERLGGRCAIETHSKAMESMEMQHRFNGFNHRFN